MAVLNYLFFKYFVDPGCQAASKKRCYDEDPKDSHRCAVSGEQADQIIMIHTDSSHCSFSEEFSYDEL